MAPIRAGVSRVGATFLEGARLAQMVAIDPNEEEKGGPGTLPQAD
jgi:hypothetical protein